MFELKARMLSHVAVVEIFNTRYFVQYGNDCFAYFKKIIFLTNKKFNASVISQIRLIRRPMCGAINL